MLKDVLKESVILVTGATSGMGAAAAEQLVSYGASVMLCGRSHERASAVQNRIVNAGGVADVFSGDITNSAVADDAVAKTVERFDRLDALVNAAGVIHRGDASATSDAQWKHVMLVNVDGTFYMSRAAVRVMNRGGSIVNFASTCGLVGAAGLAVYCASKGAIVQLTRAMALDHATDNIRVNSICPGAVDTPMLVSGYDHALQTKETVFEKSIAGIPQGRIPGPSEVAHLVAFLCSDLSAHITGTNIPIDGGYTAQ